MAAAAKQRVRTFLDEQTQKLVALRNEGVSMTSPGAKAGETILRLLDAKCCTEWRAETFEYPIVIIRSMRLQKTSKSLLQVEPLRHFLYAWHMSYVTR